MQTLFKNKNIEVTFDSNEPYIKKPIPIFNEWIEALRSGKYKQATGRLCNGEGYCCLGIASLIQGRIREIIRPEIGSSKYSDGHDMEATGYLADDNPLVEYIGNSGTLPDGIRVIYGFSEEWSSLSGLNDCNLSFNDIANIIETCFCQLTETNENEG